VVLGKELEKWERPLAKKIQNDLLALESRMGLELKSDTRAKL